MDKEDNITIDEMEKKDGATTEDISAEEMDSIIAESAEESETTEAEAVDGEELLRQLNNAAAGHTDITTIDNIIKRVRDWLAITTDFDLNEETVRNAETREHIAAAIMTRLNNERQKEIARMVVEEVALNKGNGEKDITRAAIQTFGKLLPPQPYMPASIIADILAKAGIIKILDYNGEDGTRDERAELLVYRYHDKQGRPTIYRNLDETRPLAEPEIFTIIQALNSRTSEAQRKDMLTQLRESAPRVYGKQEPDNNYIYAPNGIIDCHGIRWNPVMGLNMRPDGSTATLIPWGTPEAETIIAKEMPLRYSVNRRYIDDPGLQPPVIDNGDGTTWDPVNGIRVLFEDDDQASPDLIWQIIQATARGTNYGHAVIFANAGGGQGGGNGKDTILGLIKEIIGIYNTMAVSIHELGNENFPLDGLQNRAAIINSEEEEGKTGSRLFKLLARQDSQIPIARKHQTTLYINWRGMAIWAFNGDSIAFIGKDDAVWRGVIVIRFEKSFDIPGMRKLPVKEDYIHRPEVLEYVLWHAINKTPWLGSEGYDKDLLLSFEANRKEMRENSNPVFVFLNEMLLGNQAEGIAPKIHWTQTPTSWLYSIYKKWATEDNAMTHITATKKAFANEVRKWVGEHRDAFYFEEKNAQLGSKAHQDKVRNTHCEALEDYYTAKDPRVDVLGGTMYVPDSRDAEKQYRNRLVRIKPLDGWTV